MNYIAVMRCCVLLSVLFNRCGNDDAVGCDDANGGGTWKTPQKLLRLTWTAALFIQMSLRLFAMQAVIQVAHDEREREKNREGEWQSELEITIHRRCCILDCSAHYALQFVLDERFKVCNMWHFWLVFAVKIWIMTQSFLNMWILFLLFFSISDHYSVSFQCVQHQNDCSS